MILVNTEDIAHKKIVKSLGLVKGNTIRARNVGRDVVAVFKNMVGGCQKEKLNSCQYNQKL